MVTVKENKLEKLLGGIGNVYALFTLMDCPFCTRFKPIFDKYSKSGGAKFIEVVLSDDSPLWNEYGIEYVPTIILFKDGKIIARKDSPSMVGLSEDDFKELLHRQSQ